MKGRMKLHISLLLAATTSLLSSCVGSDFPDEGYTSAEPRPLVINARIPGAGATRALVGTNDDWSYTDFELNDAMGFFSSGGKFTEGSYGEQPFDNQKLIYLGGTGEPNFRDPGNTEFSPSHMKGNEIYMYYPYTPTITDDFGFELRTMKGHDGEDLDTARCIDFLSTRHLDIMSDVNNATTALYGEFQHTFAELIIMRGEGFDNPKYIDGKKEWQIKAVLNTPVTGIKAVVTTEGGWKCTPELVYDSVSNTMTRSQAMEWDAWLGQNFYKTETDKVGQNAWYVIVPTIGCQAKYGEQRPGPRTIVEYIELYDNDGHLQRVSSLLLSNANSKYVDGGWRYPMEITLKELVPTAYPCQITPWPNDDIDLTDERKRGINDATEFEQWVNAYNKYLEENTEETRSALLQYGDLYVSADQKYSWHFYVLNDLDLSGLKQEMPIVNELKDILDGQSTDFSNGRFRNHTISGLPTTLVGTLTGENAKVQNFTFERPDVNYGNDHEGPAGIIANYMKDGAEVLNCRITSGNLYNPGGPAGMVAGYISNSTIKDCNLSGFLISKVTVDNIVGEESGNNTYSNNNANNVTNQATE